MLNGLFREHLTHIRATGGVTDKRGAVADKGDGLVARHLKALHQTQSHEMTDVQGIGGAVKADIEGGFTVIYHFPDLVLVCYLSDKPSGNQFFVNFHFYLLT